MSLYSYEMLSERLGTGPFYNLFVMGLSVQALCWGFFPHMRMGMRLILLASFFLIAFDLLFLTVTRSGMVAFCVMIFFGSFAHRFSLHNGLLVGPRKYSKKLTRILSFAYIVIMIFAITGHLSGLAPQMSSRVNEKSSIDTRYNEIALSLPKLTSNSLIVGDGFGTLFVPDVAIYNEQRVFDAPHIGIFAFLFRGGLVVFLPVCFLLYLVIPRMFLSAASMNRKLSDGKRTAILLTFPALMAWTVLLSSSGGFDQFNAWSVGFALGCYDYFKKNKNDIVMIRK
jgi:hypothetical protein